MPEPRRGERRPRRSASSSAALPGLGFVGRSRSGGLRPRLITAAPAELIGLRPENVLRLRLIPHRCAQTEPGQPGVAKKGNFGDLHRSGQKRGSVRQALAVRPPFAIRHSLFVIGYCLFKMINHHPPNLDHLDHPEHLDHLEDLDHLDPPTLVAAPFIGQGRPLRASVPACLVASPFAAPSRVSFGPPETMRPLRLFPTRVRNARPIGPPDHPSACFSRKGASRCPRPVRNPTPTGYPPSSATNGLMSSKSTSPSKSQSPFRMLQFGYAA